MVATIVASTTIIFRIVHHQPQHGDIVASITEKHTLSATRKSLEGGTRLPRSSAEPPPRKPLDAPPTDKDSHPTLYVVGAGDSHGLHFYGFYLLIKG